MCGRFTLPRPGESVAEALGLAEAPDLLPRFNIAPGSRWPSCGRSHGPWGTS